MIADIRAREQAATKGPWRAQDFDSNPGDEGSCIIAGTDMESRAIAYSIPYPWHPEIETVADAEFIANARQDIPALLSALDAVAALHQPLDALMYAGRSQQHKLQVCTGCGQDDGNWNQWPCPTVRAITNALSEATSCTV